MSFHINKTLLLISLLVFESRLFTIASVEANLPYEFTRDGFKFYNSLPEVELADLKLQESNSFEQFLAEAQELAQHYNFEDSMGVRLIHRHTDINDDEIMVEKHENFEGKDALVTRPQSKIYQSQAAPASWIFDGEQYRVFEYSYDAHVSKAFERIRNSPDFLNEFSSLLKKYNYQNLLALAIIDREWHQNYADKLVFLERSYEKPTFASVLVNVDELGDTNTISTSWTFKKVPFTSACISGCELSTRKHVKYHYDS